MVLRLASIEHRGQRKLAAQIQLGGGEEGDHHYYCDLTSIRGNARDFLAAGSEAVHRAKELVERSKSATTNNATIPAEECRLLAPIDGSLVGKFICVGMNYVDHCTEQNIPIPTEPLIFSKFGSCIAGPMDPVPKDEHTNRLDYEVELGVVIGSTVPRHTTKEDAARCVGGFTVVHDVSARDWQLEKNGGQWLLGKACDNYAPIGPVIVVNEEEGSSSSWGMEHAQNTGIRCRVNGETLQDSNTSNLVFKVPEIIAFLSKFMTLYPGDIIATGTPPGVGKCPFHILIW